MCYRVQKSRMWQSMGGNQWQLTSYEKKLRKWLPCLSKGDVFDFIPGIEVEWVHEWPTKKFIDAPILYFIRDPRDALYSRFRRENPIISFSEFLEIRDPNTLLNKMDNWITFNDYWHAFANKAVFRFEDSKKDPEGVLREILRVILIKAPDDRIKHAIAASTFEKAAASERAYREFNPNDNEVICRAGRVNSWREGASEDDLKLFEAIHILTSRSMTAYGYDITKPIAAYYPNLVSQQKHLSFFRRLITSPNLPKATVADEDELAGILRFIANYNEKTPKKCNWKPYETTGMADTILEYSFGIMKDVQQNVVKSLGEI